MIGLNLIEQSKFDCLKLDWREKLLEHAVYLTSTFAVTDNYHCAVSGSQAVFVTMTFWSFEMESAT